MAKKKGTRPLASEQPPLDPDWEEQLPEDLADAVDDYLKAMRLKNKAAEKTRTTKEKCIELMQEHGIKKVRIDEGEKLLVLEDKHGLKTEKVKKKKDSAEGE